VPPGGALVPELLARANDAAENPREEAVLEAFGALSLVAEGAVRLGLDDGRAIELAPGERCDLPAPRETRARYVAVRGGFDVPVLLGGRGTLATAMLGGFEGRWLRQGDVLRIGDASRVDAASLAAPNALDLARPIRVVLGPDRYRFDDLTRALFLASTFLVAPARDRVGARLLGPPIPRLGDDTGRSMPMVRGAIQVPGSGALIVLGPDHPTTGGYPVIACVVSADLGSFSARPPGASVRFVEA
jgi:5-oxoprolinase (ATP-hydrolysing) subunit C